MASLPKIQYAKSGDLHIAYQVAGQGPLDLTVKDLVAGSGLQLEDQGVQRLKGVPGEWGLFAVPPST